ncbi:MAG TPA: galactokinase [Ktedonobacterales bacterium]|nr:galactokinase [Ktedonobacterales bacterium]
MREIEQRAADAYRARFGEPPEVVASAPGRVNLLGEHTDYNGGFVLPCAIERRVAIALGRGAGGLYSVDHDDAQPSTGPRVEVWADYPHGVVWALEETGARIPAFQAAITGDVPAGAGLSSSAAIEAATALALDTWLDLNIPRTDLALFCQRAENEFVKVNSGIMDQYASLLCQQGSALLIDCRSLASEQVPLDLEAAGLSLLVCDTRVKRRLAATRDYNERRATCARAAEALGLAQLRDATSEDLARLSGAELRYARHVVGENARVLAGVDALRRRDFAAFGALMWASHASLRDDYAVSTPELDAFVTLARQAGALGARLTGAGFGGCAIALIESGTVRALTESATAAFAQRAYHASLWYEFSPAAGAEVVR